MADATLKAFGIDHLSISHAKLFHEDRAQWYVRYILKEELPKIPALYRGRAVETALECFLTGGTDLNAVSKMNQQFYAELEENGLHPASDKAKREIKNLTGYYESAKASATLSGLADWNKDIGSLKSQVNVTEGFDMGTDVVGYVDFLVESDNAGDGNTLTPFELKTVGRMVTGPRLWDVQQVLFYNHCVGAKIGHLLYASPDKVRVFPIQAGSNSLIAAGVPNSLSWGQSVMMGIKSLLQTYLDANDGDVEKAKAELKMACVPDPTSYRWKDREARAIMERIWNG